MPKQHQRNGTAPSVTSIAPEDLARLRKLAHAVSACTVSLQVAEAELQQFNVELTVKLGLEGRTFQVDSNSGRISIGAAPTEIGT